MMLLPARATRSPVMYGSTPSALASANLKQPAHALALFCVSRESSANVFGCSERFACAGCFKFADANALGVLPYMTGLRVARAGRSIIVYKRDTGYGQGPSEHTPD